MWNKEEDSCFKTKRVWAHPRQSEFSEKSLTLKLCLSFNGPFLSLVTTSADVHCPEAFPGSVHLRRAGGYQNPPQTVLLTPIPSQPIL